MKNTTQNDFVSTVDNVITNNILPILRLSQVSKRVLNSGKKKKTSPTMLNLINICCAIKNIMSVAKRIKK